MGVVFQAFCGAFSLSKPFGLGSPGSSKWYSILGGGDNFRARGLILPTSYVCLLCGLIQGGIIPQFDTLRIFCNCLHLKIYCAHTANIAFSFVQSELDTFQMWLVQGNNATLPLPYQPFEMKTLKCSDTVGSFLQEALELPVFKSTILLDEFGSIKLQLLVVFDVPRGNTSYNTSFEIFTNS